MTDIQLLKKELDETIKEREFLLKRVHVKDVKITFLKEEIMKEGDR